MKMKFHIPDFWMHWSLNLDLIDLIKDHPEYFYDGVEIASCYGCFAPALWNGGRTLAGVTNYSQINGVIKEFNDRGVPVRYTFTNPTITTKDLKDVFCNKLCEAANNGMNEIICNAPVLEEYIRNTYPDYPLVSSTCKQLEEYDALMAEFEKDYKLVVLDYNWNNDFERLEKIPQDLRERCEILINPYCVPHCKRRGEHYKVLGECQRAASTNFSRIANRGKNPLKNADDFGCVNTFYNFYQITEYKTFVDREKLAKYMEMGFCNFKIEGRVLSKPNVVESYVYYMVRPEYRDKIRLMLLTSPERPSFKAVLPRRFYDENGNPINNN